MRARDFLVEYDLATTAWNYAETLYSRAYGWKPGDDDQDQPDWNLEDRKGIQLLGLDRYKRIAFDGGEKVIEWFEQNDPTGGRFVLPMIRWYLDGEMRSLEDASKLKGPIATYVKFRNRIKGVNLKTVSFDDFLTAMETQEGKLSGSDADKAEEQKFYDTKQALLVYDDPDLKIVLLKSMAASCYFGRNTRWCTTSRDKNDNMFQMYAKDGPLFVILDKDSNERWQYHFDIAPINHLRQRDHQFMDERDREVCPLTVMGGEPFDHLWEWASKHDVEAMLEAMREVVIDFEDHCSPDQYDHWCSLCGIERDYEDNDEVEDGEEKPYFSRDPRQLDLGL